MNTLTATRPLEYVCLFPADIPTQEGDAYLFFAIDTFSEFVFNTGVENQLNDSLILKHIELLINDPEFIKHRSNGFTLVLHKFEHLIFAINAIIEPFNGKVIINDPFVAQIFEPFLKSMYQNMANR